ncbi:MAG: hypothetical protein ACREDP_20980, partial [Bradyrhizobium sp.]
MTGRSFLACLLVALMTGLLLFGFSVSSPRAEGLVPDRPQCGGDAGDQIYIAIAHDVFRLPYATVEQVRALPSSDDENPIPAPPDPLVPKGCYANPVRAKSLRLNIDILSVLPNAGLPNATIPYVGLAVMPSTVSWQEAHEDWFGMVC